MALPNFGGEFSKAARACQIEYHQGNNTVGETERFWSVLPRLAVSHCQGAIPSEKLSSRSAAFGQWAPFQWELLAARSIAELTPQSLESNVWTEWSSSRVVGRFIRIHYADQTLG